MCGIAALFAYRSRSRVDRQELERMQRCMAHRGPDGEGIWMHPAGRVGLAHRRLSIIDLSASGAQPMHLDEPEISITYNGEIYNYRELRRALEKDGVRFTSDSDTEVLLQLYRRYGREMLGKLRGMFAFAIWDGRREGLFLARDPYGIKPLYYADDGETFRCASQVKALLECPGVDTGPEAAGHAGYFLWGTVPEPWTLFQGIRALPAGHDLWVEQGRSPRLNRYASLAEILAGAEEPAGNETPDRDALSQVLRQQLRDSLRHHMVADVEVGVFLSAGLDSTTLTALASEFRSSLRTVTLGFERYRGTDRDETALAEEAARRYGTDHRTVWLDHRDFHREKQQVFRAMDQPSVDGLNTYFVSKITAEAGLKVALSGIGGDELFGGYGGFRRIPRLAGLVRRVPFGDRLAGPFRALSYPLFRRMGTPKLAGLLEWGRSLETAYFLKRGLYLPSELPQVLPPDVAVEGLEKLETRSRLYESTLGVKGHHARITALESSWYMRNQLLRDADWAGMAHSLEIRVPLVDWHLARELAPFVNHPGFDKNSMAATPRRELPSSIRNRPKSGFNIPVREWLTEEQGEGDVAPGQRGWARYVYRNYCESCGASSYLS